MAEHAGNGTRGQDTFKALLEEMPAIAKAVNAFSSESVQQRAFDALVDAYEGGRSGPVAAKLDPPSTQQQQQTRKPRKQRKQPAAGTGQATTSKRRSGPPKQLKDLDLAPRGTTSLADFVKEKDPTTNHDRNVVSVYYLLHKAEIGAVDLDHVFTCYRDMGWAIPSDLANSLAMTSSKKRYLDTSDLDNIRLTSRGLNRVEQELPKPAKS
jgi:hypothetical protein